MNENSNQNEQEEIVSTPKKTHDRPKGEFSTTEFQDCQERWREGVARREQFLQLLPTCEREAAKTINTLNLIFLAEKPSTYGTIITRNIAKALEKSGLRVLADFKPNQEWGELSTEQSYIYDPEQVRQVLRDPANAYLLGDYFDLSADQVMEILYRTHRKDADAPLGLVLGFPQKAVMDYEQMKIVERDPIIFRLHDLITPEERAELFSTVEKSNEDSRAATEMGQVNIKLLLRYQSQLSLDDQAISKEINKISDDYTWLSTKKVVSFPGFDWAEFGQLSQESKDKEKRVRAALKVFQDL